MIYRNIRFGPFDPIRQFIEMIVPRDYENLANIWGIAHPYGPLIAFGASILLMFGILWLGVLLSFGRIMENNENVKKALMLLSGGFAVFVTYGLAETIVYFLSNILYLFTTFGVLVVIGSIIRALTAGYRAAGASTAEARKLEYIQKAEMERARRAYEEQLHLRLTAAKRIVQDLDVALNATISNLDALYYSLKNNRTLKSKYSNYYEMLLDEISKIINLLKEAKNSKDAASKYNALRDAQMKLELLASAEIKQILGDTGNMIAQKIRSITENIKSGLFRADKDLKDLVKLYSSKQKKSN